MTLPSLNFITILPELILVVAAMAVLLLDLVVREKRALAWFGLVAALLALAATVLLVPAGRSFADMMISDGMSQFLGAAILIASVLAILLAMGRVANFSRWVGAYYALVLLAASGMLVMVGANNFLTIFLGLEILSLALYILAGFAGANLRSGEAALKYFLLGAFASGFFLYGIALVYAATGTTSLADLATATAAANSALPGVPLLPIGMGLLIVGFGFKLALVPFHMWTPDVYQGAPTEVTAFMSVATKAAAFGAFIRVLTSVSTTERPWLLALAALAVLSMTLGNLAALRQSSLKRMLAYSSIAQAGYVLTGLAAGNSQGVQGALYYLLAYTFMNIGAFAVILAVQRAEEMDVTYDRLVGLAGRRPGLAALMALFMLSLTGIPPLAGFFAKLYVFSAAVQGGLTWLAVVGVINSAVAAYYYLRVIVAMYMAEPAPEPVAAAIPTPGTTQPGRSPRPAGGTARTTVPEPAPVPAVAPAPAVGQLPIRWTLWAALAITAAGTVVLGVWQFPWMQSINQAVAMLTVR